VTERRRCSAQSELIDLETRADRLEAPDASEGEKETAAQARCNAIAGALP